jgi:hypothetical protein
MHRFRYDLEWGHILRRFRLGECTEDDIDRINERVVTSYTALPEDLRYATYFNRDRDSINAALFEERCKRLYAERGNTSDSVMIFSDDLQVQNGSKVFVPFKNSATFWEGCGKDDVKTSRQSGRMDPVLRLYTSCRLMLPCNKDVGKGQANGAQVTLERVILKPNVSPTTVLVGGTIPVNAVRASQVSHIVVRHCNPRVNPAVFSIEPKKHSFKGRLLKPRMLQTRGNDRENLRMKACQIPVLINNATTGHKLQGSGVDILFVHNWSYTTNWPYVMLSRVKTRDGLFLRKKLSKDLRKYAVPESLQRMLRRFSRRAPTYWSDDEYQQLFQI